MPCILGWARRFSFRSRLHTASNRIAPRKTLGFLASQKTMIMSNPTLKKILIQLDTDPMASSFDAVVAVDAGSDILLQYSGVTPENVTGLVHGAMFTRSPSKLKHTAIFVGGSQVDRSEAVYEQVTKTFFGPIRVSAVMDANGCNTTSVAAVQAAMEGESSLGLRAGSPSKRQAFIFGGTGPVGQRIARLLGQQGVATTLHSRSLEKGQQVAQAIQAVVPSAELDWTTETGTSLLDRLLECSLIFNASAAGVESLSEEGVKIVSQRPGVLVDLNAVPPAGIHGVGAHDWAVASGQRLQFGALAVGNWKMKLHRGVIQACFESNDKQFGLNEIAEWSRALWTHENQVKPNT